MLKKIKTSIQTHIIDPVVNSFAPVAEVSWGVAIGLFVGLTPTVGVQMYIVAAIWGVCRYFLRFRFTLPVGVAMVWVSNPLTMVPMYYVFLYTGAWMLGTSTFDYAHFEHVFLNASHQDTMWNSIVQGTHFLVIDLGIPMMLGGFFYAIPCAIFSFFLTQTCLTRYRQSKAEQANMTYEEWRDCYETSA